MNRIHFFIASFLLLFGAKAQDSLGVFTYEAYMAQVMENHPFTYRADIAQKIGAAELRQSRGAFDPKLFGNIDQKYFEDKQYYSHIKGGIQIPTWFGLSGEAGYMLNDGVYLNPEQRVPDNGLWYAGLRLDLGNGLIIDQRRADFMKAKRIKESSELERTILLNELQRDASIAYWQWQQAYQSVVVYQNAYDNAVIRLNAVKEAAKFGDQPYIDTVEASMSVQNRKIDLMQAKTKSANSELELELFLWADGFIPLELENVRPTLTNLPSPQINPLVTADSILANHPYMRLYEIEIEQRKIDLQLKREQLKPKLSLKYNAINAPLNGDPIAGYASENYTWGATFAYPILTRKERGGVQIAKLKLEDQELKNKVSRVDLENKIRKAFNDYALALDQLSVMQQLVNNNQRMYNAERTLFELGESSVFMMNSRESAWLKAQVELIESEARCKMLKAILDWQIMSFSTPEMQ